MRGSIPRRLDLATKLQHFLAAGNVLLGSLPDALGSLFQLQRFKVGTDVLHDGNELTGHEPQTQSGAVTLQESQMDPDLAGLRVYRVVTDVWEGGVSGTSRPSLGAQVLAVFSFVSKEKSQFRKCLGKRLEVPDILLPDIRSLPIKGGCEGLTFPRFLRGKHTKKNITYHTPPLPPPPKK